MIIESKTSFADKAVISSIASKLPKNATVVDLGTYMGSSASVLAEATEILHSKIYTIDTFENHNDYNDSRTIGIRETAADNLKNYKNVTIINEKSSEASKKFEDKSIDMIFIDADHTYLEVKKDILTWLPKIKEGGIMSGHDYNQKFIKVTDKVVKAVQKAVLLDIHSDGHAIPINCIDKNSLTVNELEVLKIFTYPPQEGRDFEWISIHAGVFAAVHEIFGTDFTAYSPYVVVNNSIIECSVWSKVIKHN